MAVAFRKCGKLLFVQLQHCRWIDQDPYGLSQRLTTTDNRPLSITLFEKIVMPSHADHIYKNTIESGALIYRHLHLGDGAITSDVTRPAPERVQDIHSFVETFTTHLDKLLCRSLKPRRCHPAVGVPECGKTFPISRVAIDYPIFYHFTYCQLSAVTSVTIALSSLPGLSRFQTVSPG